MKLNLSPVETETLLSWKKESGILFPSEENLATLLKGHQGGEIELSENQVVILSSWAEASVDGHFGRGAITNPVEASLLAKIKDLYSAISGNETAE